MAASTKGEGMTKRSVVSSFIYKIEDGKASVALFRRSGEVNTYKHCLAPISGSIDKADASPVAAAWREVREETTLTSSSLVLERQGKSYVFSDSNIGREWTIYPFAFRLKTPKEDDGAKGEEGIEIDWEHESWGWYDPLMVEDSDGFEGVPRLAESLRRVWFEKDLGETSALVLAKGLQTLQNDFQSGARRLAGTALDVLRQVVQGLDTQGGTEQWWFKVRSAAWHIWKNGRESMGAAIISALLTALSGIEDTLRQHEAHPDSSHSMKWRDAVLEGLERQAALREASSSNLVSKAFVKYLETNLGSRLTASDPLTILTLSDSSTISHSIRHLTLEAGFSLDLRVLESRPLYEGVSLAGSFAADLIEGAVETSRPTPDSQNVKSHASRVTIRLYTDAAAALASKGVDIVLIGADRIASTGAVSNKTGSLPAILSAKHVTSLSGKDVKVVVLAESEKIAAPDPPQAHVVENNDSLQVTRAWDTECNSKRVRLAASILENGCNGRPASYHQLKPHKDVDVDVVVHNVFFEWCPPSVIDVYVTEFGRWTVEEISSHSQRLGAEQERLFGDL